jgi:hydroxymethylpyrimidine pyrophosphatase-like HAD family hydrolase
MSVRSPHYSPGNNPEERSSHLLSGRSLKSHSGYMIKQNKSNRWINRNYCMLWWCSFKYRKSQQQSQERWHLSWLPGHLRNRKRVTHVTWWSPSYLLLIDTLKVSLWAFWIGFNGWRIWHPVSRTNCTNNKDISVKLLQKQVLGTIYGELFFKHNHVHSKTRKKYTILIYRGWEFYSQFQEPYSSTLILF